MNSFSRIVYAVHLECYKYISYIVNAIHIMFRELFNEKKVRVIILECIENMNKY